MIREVGDLTVLNSRSIGQPRGGDPRASYALIDSGRIEFRRVKYDVEEIIREIREGPPRVG